MDFDTRLKALARLAHSKSGRAGGALKKELQEAVLSLTTESQYDVLEQNLAVLEVIGHRFSREASRALLTFIDAIGKRKVTYSEELGSFIDRVAEYQNSDTLIVRALEVLGLLRYLEIDVVLHGLMRFSRHASGNVREKVDGELKALARYDMRVFYGDKEQPGIGAAPQLAVLQSLEALSNQDLRKNFRSATTLVTGVLSPTVQGTTWKYNSVTISQGATPANAAVAEVRSRAINLLKRLYRASSTISEKLTIVNALSDASRSHHIGQSNADVANMIAANTIEVLEFFAELIGTEEFQVLQKIEHNSYWMFFHAGSDDIKLTAHKVERSIARHAEYQIYKTLIGFEGIFHDWTNLKAVDNRWEETDQIRKDAATKFISSINDGNFEEWRARIIEYSKTQSDDLATFPVFYQFLESFALARPNLALRLVSDDFAQIERFLIPLLRGLWAGPEQSNVRMLIESWTGSGQYLYQCIKLFLNNEKLDLQLLAHLLARATEVSDLNAVALLMSVAVSNYETQKEEIIRSLFLPALKTLTEHSNADWIFDFWFRSQTREIVAALDDRGVELFVRNLRFLRKIDFHAEEILVLIANRAPEKVMELLCQRLGASIKKEEVKKFEAIPFELHKLHIPLSKIPAIAVNMVRKTYDGDFGMFCFRGGRLLKIIFPGFPPEFENALAECLRSGDDNDIEFVLAVLRNYQGQSFTHNLLNAIIRNTPNESKYRNEVAAALMTTGVVSGEYGIAEAYDRKKEEVREWLNDTDVKIREFAKRYMAEMERLSGAERKRADEEIALRKHRFGE